MSLFGNPLYNGKQEPRGINLGGQLVIFNPDLNTVYMKIGSPFNASFRFVSWGEELRGDCVSINQEIKNYLLSHEYTFIVFVESLNKKFNVTTLELGSFFRTHSSEFPYKGKILHVIPLKIMHEVVYQL